MKLLTSEIKKKLSKYPLYSQEGKGGDTVCVCKLFLCQGAWTWYITEWDGNDTAFGIIVNGRGEAEIGYISISELMSVRTRLGLGVERDIYFSPTKVRDIKDNAVKRLLEDLGYEH